MTRPLRTLLAAALMLAVGAAVLLYLNRDMLRAAAPDHAGSPTARQVAPSPSGIPFSRYGFSYEVRFTNRQKRPVDVVIKAPVVRSWGDHQKVLELQMSPSPRREWRDVHHNQMAEFDLSAVPPGRTATVRIQAELACAYRVTDVRAADLPLMSQGALPLPSEPQLPSAHPEVVRTAREVTRGEDIPYYQVLRLYDFVRGFQFRLGNPARPVVKVLEDRVAQCSDAAALLVSLVRSRGIPARYVAGRFLQDEEPESGVAHAWLEVDVPGVGWAPVDPTMGRFDAFLRSSRFLQWMPEYVVLWRGTVTDPFQAAVRGKGSAGDVKVVFRHTRRGGAASRAEVLARMQWRTSSRSTALPQATAADREDIARASDLRHGEAERTLRAVLERNGSLEAYAALARFYIQTKQPSAALECLRPIISEGAAAAGPYDLLVDLFAGMDLWDGVAQVSNEARARVPEPLVFASAAGQAYVKLGDFQSALPPFQQAVALSPNDGWLHAMLGWTLKETGQRQAAKDEIERGLSLGIEGSERGFFERMARDLAR